MTNELIVLDDHSLATENFTLDKSGLIMKDLTHDQWCDLGRLLGGIESRTQWWIGDWYNYLGWGNRDAELIKDLTGLEYSTVQNYGYIASRYKYSIRCEYLSFKHHQVAASWPEDEREYWLQWAVEHGASVKDMKTARRAQQVLPPPDYTEGEVTIYNGDALAILPTLPEQKYNLLLADPPYNTGRIDWDTWDTEQDFLEWTAEWLDACLRLMHAEYNAFVFCSPRYAPFIELDILRPRGIVVKSRIIWNHRNMSMGRDVSDRFINTYDTILHFGTCNLNWPPDWDDRRFDVQIHAAPQTNFDDTKIHQTQKPIELIELLCSVGSKPGDHVLDPFSGSGTTGAAALKLGRHCTLMDNQYAHLTAQRLGVSNVL